MGAAAFGCPAKRVRLRKMHQRTKTIPALIRNGIYLLTAGVITNRVPSSEKKICRTPCFRQLFVQAFISGSSIIFVPCCMSTQDCAHWRSSTEWHMQRQHSARSRCCAGRDTPVSGNEARTTAKTANLGPLIMDVPNRFISQIKASIRCILCPFRPLCQITVVISRAGLYALTWFLVWALVLRQCI